MLGCKSLSMCFHLWDSEIFLIIRKGDFWDLFPNFKIISIILIIGNNSQYILRNFYVYKMFIIFEIKI